VSGVQPVSEGCQRCGVSEVPSTGVSEVPSTCWKMTERDGEVVMALSASSIPAKRSGNRWIVPVRPWESTAVRG